MASLSLVSLNALRPAGLGPISSIDEYIQFTHGIPMLEEGEEQELGRLLREENDLKAAQRLVLSHLRFVVKIARSFSGYGLQLADLIQEGNIGLMKAVKRFDPTIGVRLAAFAVHWIKSEIHDFVIRNWKIVRVATTKAQRKLFFNLRQFKKKATWFAPSEAQAIAKELNVRCEDVLEMEQRLSAHDQAFDLPDDKDSDEYRLSPVHHLTSRSQTPEEALLLEEQERYSVRDLASGVSMLDERSKDIITRRWLVEHKLTLHDLAAEYKISAERVRQLESQAMKKLRKLIKA